MSLALVDSLVIVFFVVDLSICGQFLSSEPYLYKVTYPYLLHPVRNMVLTASIFMVVAISAERYVLKWTEKCQRSKRQIEALGKLVGLHSFSHPRIFQIRTMKTFFWMILARQRHVLAQL